MRKGRAKFITAMMLSLVLIFTMVPATAFADDGDVTVNLIVKNINFDKDYLDKDGNICSPEWTGSMSYKITVAQGQAVGEAISAKLGGNVNYSFGYISGFFGLYPGATVESTEWGGAGGWFFGYNGALPDFNIGALGIDQYINGVEAGKKSISNGDVFTYAYSLDMGVTEVPYIQVPYSAKAKKTSYNSNTITWGAYGNIDVWGNGFTTDYVLERAKKAKGPYEPIKTVTSTAKKMSYADKNLKTGTTYYYRVKMVKGKNESKYSSIVSAKPTLSKPVIKKISKKGKKSLTIKWKKVDGATQYQVYRATKKNGKYKKIKTVSAKKTSFTNKKLKKGKKYFYKVRAVIKVDKKNVYSAFSAKKSKKR